MIPTIEQPAGGPCDESEEVLRGRVMRYSVVVHRAEEGGFWVEVPALPGCYSQGESVEDALGNGQEAIELYLEVLRDEGRKCA